MRVPLFLLTFSLVQAWPVHFEPNGGQVAGRTEWVARASGITTYIASNEVVLDRVHMRLVGAAGKARAEGLEPTGGYSNYFVGRTQKDWFTGIPHYARVRYQGIYPGIDVVYYASGRNVEYDFEVRPGADPNRIELAFDHNVCIDERGDLVITATGRELHQHRPRVLQDGREIASAYRLFPGNRVGLWLGNHDSHRALTVDPVLEFSTYLGGPGADSIAKIVFDSAGNLVLAGSTQTPASPALDPFQQSSIVSSAPFVMKLSSDGRRVIYFSVIGSGSGGNDSPSSMALDASGSPVVTGTTYNPNFPLKNAFQNAYTATFGEAFITKLSADGRSIVYSSYYGGSGFNTGGSLQLDGDGNAYLVGHTSSSDLPIKNALQSQFAGGYDCYIAKLAPAGSLIFSTYLGGSGIDNCGGLALGPDGSLIFTGTAGVADFPLKDAPQTTASPGNFGAPVLVKMAPDGQSLILSTYLGGENFVGWGGGVTTDSAGNIYVTGRAFNPFLTVKNAYQTTWTDDLTGWIMELDPLGKNLVFATYFGGGLLDGAVVDKDLDIYVSGTAFSPDFPVKNSLQPFLGGGPLYDNDAFLAKFAPSGKSLIYSTLLGGTRRDEGGSFVVDAQGTVYLTGTTYSSDFPVKNAYQSKFGGGSTDGFLAKISDNSPIIYSPISATPSRLVFQYVQQGPTPVMQTVAVIGESFFVTATALWLSALGTAAQPPENVQVTVNPGGLAPGSYSATVKLNPQSGKPAATIDVALTVLAPAPVITSVEPSVVPVGSDDTLITVHGSGFTSGTKVYVDEVAWTLSPVTIVDSGTLTLKLPKLYFTGVYNYSITVQNPQSAMSNAGALAVGKPGPQVTGVQNAASYAGPPVAPGEMVVIYGSNFGTVDTMQVTFDNVSARLIYATPNQLAATVPYLIPHLMQTSLAVLVNGVYSAPIALSVAPSAPALFTSDASGGGQAAALNQDNSINASANPAPGGSVVVLFGTGGGLLTKDTLPQLQLLVSATIGGIGAQVLYAGVAPGEPEGVLQFNLQLPSGVASGNAPVIVTVGSATSNTVTLSIG
jgi:uncharacterized protein (TIGR03437 family)